jgi:TetR/AcrR family transcriptional regulator, transcriptional repressor for nem operon
MLPLQAAPSKFICASACSRAGSWLHEFFRLKSFFQISECLLSKDFYLCKPNGRFMNDTKEHIIIISSELFLKRSFKEVTMQEIVQKTGLSKGAFYHHFKSKEQLFLEVLEYFFSHVFIHKYETYSRDSFYNFYHDYANAVKEMGKSYLNKLKEKDNSFNMNHFTLIFDALKLFPDFRDQITSGLKQELEIWKSVISDARQKGEIASTMTDEEIALTYISLSDGIAMHMIVKGLAINEVKEMFLNLWDKLYELIKA